MKHGFDRLHGDADYRQRYVLRYTASGVPRPGWHDVTVTVPRLPKAQVDAKRGHFDEPGVR